MPKVTLEISKDAKDILRAFATFNLIGTNETEVAMFLFRQALCDVVDSGLLGKMIEQRKLIKRDIKEQ